MQKNEKGPLSHPKIKCLFRPSDPSTKIQKGPLSHQKIKCLFLDYIQLLMIGQAIQAKNVDRNAKIQKGPQKIKCLFLDYVQLLMKIRAKNV